MKLNLRDFFWLIMTVALALGWWRALHDLSATRLENKVLLQKNSETAKALEAHRIVLHQYLRALRQVNTIPN